MSTIAEAGHQTARAEKKDALRKACGPAERESRSLEPVQYKAKVSSLRKASFDYMRVLCALQLRRGNERYAVRLDLSTDEPFELGVSNSID